MALPPVFSGAPSSATAATRQASSSPSDVPFSQVLSDEMAQQEPSAAPPVAAENGPATHAAASAPAASANNAWPDNPAPHESEPLAGGETETPALPPAMPAVLAPDALAFLAGIPPAPAATDGAAAAETETAAPTEAGSTVPLPATLAAMPALPAAGAAAETRGVTTAPAAPSPALASAVRLADEPAGRQPIPHRLPHASFLPAGANSADAGRLPAAAESAMQTPAADTPAAFALPPAAQPSPLPHADPQPPQAGPPQYRLAPPLGTPAWNQALGDRISWMVRGGEHTALLALNPPELGPLQVVLSVSNDQVSASFFSHEAAVRQAVEAALPRLREMMSEAGVQLGQTTVSADLPRQNDTPDRPAAAAFGSRHPAAGRLQTSDLSHAARAGIGLVDTYA